MRKNTMTKSYKYPLKLDFNERSDNQPLWLDAIALSKNTLWSYPDKSSLETAICNQLGISKKQLLITNGGDEAIELLFKYSKLNNRNLILPLPAFSQYLLGETIWKLALKKVAARNDLSLDIEAVKSLIKKASAGEIVIITSPNNPTGETLSLELIRELCSDAQKSGVMIFLDQAYIEFTEQAQQSLSLIQEFDNLLMLRTLSKAYGLAAIRVGYLLGNPQLIANFNEIALPFNNSQSSLDIAKAAFTEQAQLEIAHYRKIISSNRELIANFLEEKKLSLVKSEANFLLVTGDRFKLKLIAAACKKLNIQIKTQLVGLSTNQNLDAIRISIPSNTDRLMQALKMALEPELICFDMDGVLIDTSASYDQSIIETVRFFTEKNILQKDIRRLRKTGGFNNDWKLARQLIRELGFEVALSEVTQVFQEYYLGNQELEALRLKESALIEASNKERFFISNSRKLKTAIITGRPLAEAKQGLELLQIKNTLLISDDDVEKSKPDPEGVMKAKRYYQVDSSWMVGDAPDDILAANQAGAISIGIGSKDLTRFGADLVLDNVNQLEALL